ncbi:hypothetical protein ACFY2K_26170 [Kitasatospora sp. NPDC001309]|uniref:hypothetical protein n=1 Tax=Kitasatospora sp. NPDC001309 TaxID=3364013 RepID=UPI0036AD617C
MNEEKPSVGARIITVLSILALIGAITVLIGILSMEVVFIAAVFQVDTVTAIQLAILAALLVATAAIVHAHRHKDDEEE